MRFTNGTWDVKEGIKINSAVEVSKLSILEAQKGNTRSNSFLPLVVLYTRVSHFWLYRSERIGQQVKSLASIMSNSSY